MFKQEVSGGDTNSWARVCDTCGSAPCTVYCRADAAYLCTTCDARIHGANQVASRHERVWVCEACERAPAAFLCKADSASLCATCDADIHSANPLARRHHRVPIMPVSGCGYGHPRNDPSGRMSEDRFLFLPEGDETTDEGDEDEAASWLLLNPPSGKKNSSTQNIENSDGFFEGEGGDEYLDLFEYNSGADSQFCDQQYHDKQQEFSVPDKSCGGDSVVPGDQCAEGKEQHQVQYQNFLFGFECDTKPGYNYNTTISHSVSVSSLDVGVVPDSTMSDISMSHPRPPKGTIDLFSNPPMQIPTQLSPLDREARVMRYREKKKNRKFEKTIRYASRKAYAETRPRIKGRFAKRTDVDAEVDQMFSNGLMSEGGYGIVPSF